MRQYFKHFQLLNVSWTSLFLSLLYKMGESGPCQSYRTHNNVSYNVSECFSYETFTSPKPTYMCVQKCHTIPGCIATGSDSVETTSTCCTLVEKNINILAGNSTIIHQSQVSMCPGSDWTGLFTSQYAPDESAFSFKLRFQGLAKNCSHFTGKRTIFSFFSLSVHK